MESKQIQVAPELMKKNKKSHREQKNNPVNDIELIFALQSTYLTAKK